MDIHELAENLAVNNGISSRDSENNDISYSTNKDDGFECFMSPRGTRKGTSTSNVGKKDRPCIMILISMLQQQQAMLERVLKSQESLELCQNEVEQKISQVWKLKLTGLLRAIPVPAVMERESE